MIFVDSSFWIAQQIQRDRHHRAARLLTDTYANAPLTTSNAVVAETWTYLRRKTGHARAIAWLDRLVSTAFPVSQIGESTEAEAWDWLRAHDERAYSFVDATSFALMRKLRIREALAFDGDFAAAGFVELRP